MPRSSATTNVSSDLEACAGCARAARATSAAASARASRKLISVGLSSAVNARDGLFRGGQHRFGLVTDARDLHEAPAEGRVHAGGVPAGALDEAPRPFHPPPPPAGRRIVFAPPPPPPSLPR